MARNWLRAFRPASFRGVPFEVEVEGVAGARRLAVSPIAYGERSIVEDMGREPRQLAITAYVAGEIADAAAMALTAALDAPGASLLVLPMMPPSLSRVSDWRMQRERLRAGFVGFEVLFMEAGLTAAPFGAGTGLGQFGDMMEQGAALLSDVFG